jgi:hypothetical protein
MKKNRFQAQISIFFNAAILAFYDCLHSAKKTYTLIFLRKIEFFRGGVET